MVTTLCRLCGHHGGGSDSPRWHQDRCTHDIMTSHKVMDVTVPEDLVITQHTMDLTVSRRHDPSAHVVATRPGPSISSRTMFAKQVCNSCTDNAVLTVKGWCFLRGHMQHNNVNQYEGHASGGALQGMLECNALSTSGVLARNFAVSPAPLAHAFAVSCTSWIDCLDDCKQAFVWTQAFCRRQRQQPRKEASSGTLRANGLRA